MRRNDKTFIGKGRTFDEALMAAIAEGGRNVVVPNDAMVKWTIATISGRSGGILGRTEITVELKIQAEG